MSGRTLPCGVLPFQFAISGTREPPSHIEPFAPLICRLCTVPDSRAVPLSPENTMTVFSRRPRRSISATTLPSILIHISDVVREEILAVGRAVRREQNGTMHEMRG